MKTMVLNRNQKDFVCRRESEQRERRERELNILFYKNIWISCCTYDHYYGIFKFYPPDTSIYINNYISGIYLKIYY